MRCRVCGSKDIAYLSEINDIGALVEYSQCNTCGREFMAKAQTKANEARRKEIVEKHNVSS